MIGWIELLDSKIKDDIHISEQSLQLIKKYREGELCGELLIQLHTGVIEQDDIKSILVELLGYELYLSKKYNGGMKPMIPQATLDLNTTKDLEKFVSWYTMNGDYKTIYRFIDFNEIARMFLDKVGGND